MKFESRVPISIFPRREKDVSEYSIPASSSSILARSVFEADTSFPKNVDTDNLFLGISFSIGYSPGSGAALERKKSSRGLPLARARLSPPFRLLAAALQEDRRDPRSDYLGRALMQVSRAFVGFSAPWEAIRAKEVRGSPLRHFFPWRGFTTTPLSWINRIFFCVSVTRSPFLFSGRTSFPSPLRVAVLDTLALPCFSVR